MCRADELPAYLENVSSASQSRVFRWPARDETGAGDHGRMVEHVQQQLQEALGPVLAIELAPQVHEGRCSRGRYKKFRAIAACASRRHALESGPERSSR